jgi:metal-responsive CopG/Arc/MetJ family transcriptional regulator
MAAKPVQISLDVELLRRIDRDAETRKNGRSAFIRAAVLAYLEARRRKTIDEQIRTAFRGNADDLTDEIADLIGAQAWPKT